MEIETSRGELILSALGPITDIEIRYSRPFVEFFVSDLAGGPTYLFSIF